jgi:hypothetical protein
MALTGDDRPRVASAGPGSSIGRAASAAVAGNKGSQPQLEVVKHTQPPLLLQPTINPSSLIHSINRNTLFHLFNNQLKHQIQTQRVNFASQSIASKAAGIARLNQEMGA